MKRILFGYLVVSSVVLHLVVLGVGVWMMSNMRDAMARADNSFTGRGESAIVRDVMELTEGDYIYQGYLLEFRGKPLYVEGHGRENVHIGDEVTVNISKHPYAPIKSLMVSIDNHRPNQARDADATK